jgi:hypothetical protein
MAKLSKDIRVYRGDETETDHYFIRTKVLFPPRSLKNNRNYQKPSDLEEHCKSDF